MTAALRVYSTDAKHGLTMKGTEEPKSPPPGSDAAGMEQTGNPLSAAQPAESAWGAMAVGETTSL